MKRLVLFSFLSMMFALIGCAHSPSTEGEQALSDLNQAPEASSSPESDAQVAAAQQAQDSGVAEVAAAPSEPPVVSDAVPGQGSVDTPAYSEAPKHRVRRHKPKSKKVAHRRHKHGKRVAKKKHHKHHDAAE